MEPTWIIVIASLVGFVGFGVFLNWASEKHAANRDRMTPEERADWDNDRA